MGPTALIVGTDPLFKRLLGFLFASAPKSNLCSKEVGAKWSEHRAKYYEGGAIVR